MSTLWPRYPFVVNTVNTKPYHHGNLREEMVRIGVQLAAEGGPEAVSLRKIARRAGVSPSAAYRHFPGQDSLLGAVRHTAADALGRSMQDAVSQVAADAPAAERVIAAGRGYFEFALDRPMLFRCLASGFELPEQDSQDSPFARLLELVGGLEREALAVVDAAARFDAAVALWSAVHGISVLCTSGALRDVPPPRNRELLEVTLATAVRGLRF